MLREFEKALRKKMKLPAVRSAEIVDFVSSEATQVVDKAEPANVNVDAADARVLGEALASAAAIRHRRRRVAAARSVGTLKMFRLASSGTFCALATSSLVVTPPTAR